MASINTSFFTSPVTSQKLPITSKSVIHMCIQYYHRVWYSLVPRLPLNPPRGKGDLVNTVQHFCTSAEFRWHNLIGWFGNYLTCTGLPYCKPLSFTHQTFTDPPFLFGGRSGYNTKHGIECPRSGDNSVLNQARWVLGEVFQKYHWQIWSGVQT